MLLILQLPSLEMLVASSLLVRESWSSTCVASRHGSRPVGFDLEGATQGLHLTVRAGLMNEAVVVFSKPSQNERHFCFVSELESATKITLD
jgi:hypothetical protein